MSEENQEQELITSESRIFYILDEIRETASSLSISARDVSEEYSTTIASIDRAKGKIVVRQLIPSSWRDCLEDLAHVDIKCFLNGIRISFSSKLHLLEDNGSIALFELNIPDEVFYFQMRSYFRVPLPAKEARVSLQLVNGSAINCTASNISLGGGLCLMSEHPENLKCGDILKNCRIEAKDLLDFAFSAEVCHIDSGEDNNPIGIGLKFIDLPAKHRNAVQQAIVKLERQKIKARVRTR